MKSCLHFLFLVTLFGVTFLFLFCFSVCGFTHSLSFPCIFFCCIFLFGGFLLYILVDFLIRRATNTHVVRVRVCICICFPFVCICICFPFAVCCVYGCVLCLVGVGLGTSSCLFVLLVWACVCRVTWLFWFYDVVFLVEF